MTTYELIRFLIFLAVIAFVFFYEVYFICRFLINIGTGAIAVLKFFTKPAITAHFLVLAALLCFLYGFLVEPYWIEVKRVPLFTPKLKDATIRIVQFSDTHCERKIANERRLVSIINSLDPDVVVFTGDALNRAQSLTLFKDTLKGINANLGKFAVKGNWDVIYWRCLDLFGGTGFKVMDGNSAKLTKNGEDFFISGVSYENSYRWGQALGGVPDNYFSVFLCHSPDLIEDLKWVNVDLYLAGHTHGGQIALPFYGALITLSKHDKKYESGKHIFENTVIYVNRGLGLEGGFFPRARFFSRPEITVFDIMPLR